VPTEAPDIYRHVTFPLAYSVTSRYKGVIKTGDAPMTNAATFFVLQGQFNSYVCKKSANRQWIPSVNKRAMKLARTFKTQAAAQKFADDMSVDVTVVEVPAARAA
jgi:hypothetical protein